jgi:hypothetical protein
LSQQAQTQLLREYGSNYEVWLAAARTEQARGNASAATRYFKQARDVYQQSSGTSNGANPFAASPFAADGTAQVAAQAPDGNPFRAQQAQPQQAAAPAMPNPFALGGGTRLQTTAPRQQNGLPPRRHGQSGRFCPQGNFNGAAAQGNYQAPNGFAPAIRPGPGHVGRPAGQWLCRRSAEQRRPFRRNPASAGRSGSGGN